MMSIRLALSGLIVFLGGCQGLGLARLSSDPAAPLRTSRQVVLVVSDNWDAQTAQMQCFDRQAGGPWQRVGEPVLVSIGRTGLAWGRGLHGEPTLPGPIKQEGDGKAPAGIFELLSAFGYVPQDDQLGINLPYIHLTDDVVGVDDVKSRYYNQIVWLDQVNKDWDSAETMRRPDGLYQWGVLVGHNVPPKAGAGSCIFLHIWRGAGMPTAGCTAMSTQDMKRLITWLDPQYRPVLVQLPREEYQKLASTWFLPVRE